MKKSFSSQQQKKTHKMQVQNKKKPKGLIKSKSTLHKEICFP